MYVPSPAHCAANLTPRDQVAALKLIDQGKLKVDTPVSEYIPELADPVIVNDLNPTSETQSTPAKNIMTVKHLLNFSSGLFYPDKRGKPEDLVDAYCQSYSKGNAVSEFISYIKVCGPFCILLISISYELH